MPDADLAALVRGEDKPESVKPPIKKHKTCPYCTSQVFLRAQKCKRCGGNLTATVLQGRDWQGQPATAGQRMFLKKMKIGVSGPVSQGQAAGMISTAKLQDPDLFAQVAASGGDRSGGRKGSGALIKAAIFLLIVGGVLGGLKRAGKLGSVISAAKRAASTMKEQVAPAAGQAPAASADDPNERTLAMQTDYEEIEDPRAPAAGDPGSDTIQPGRDTTPIETRFSAEHRPPKIGSTLLVQLRTGGVLKGVLMRLDETGIAIKRGVATVQFQKKQLSAITRAVCYRDDYVAFRAAQHEGYIAQRANSRASATRYESAERSRQDRLNATRRAQQARASNRIVSNRKKTGGLPPPTTATERAASVPTTSGNTSMGEWMKKYNTDNSRLLARQQRVKAHEQKSAREGLPQ